MNIFVARQSRLGFGTIAVVSEINPSGLKDNAISKIVQELQEMVEKEELSTELVIGTALRYNFDELKRLIALDPTEKNLLDIRRICDNVKQAFHSIG
jgi:uncharacterized protein YqgV (UPF0045/DUF77 family)